MIFIMKNKKPKFKLGSKIILIGRYPCDTRHPDDDVLFITHFGVVQTVKKITPKDKFHDELVDTDHMEGVSVGWFKKENAQ